MRARRVALAALCILGSVLALSVAPAQGALTHRLLSQVYEVPAEGPEGEPVPVHGPLERVQGLGAYAGRLYVAEPFGSERVVVFDASTGKFVLEFPQAPELKALGYLGLSVGASRGETQVYVGADDGSVPGEGVVAVFDGAGKLLGTWDGSDTPLGSFGFAGVVGVAVDNSPSLTWASGDVYVADRAEQRVDVFRPLPGGKEERIAQLAEAEPGVPFAFGEEEGAIAVDQQSGELLVQDRNVVDIFKPAALIGTFERVGQLTGTPGGGFVSIASLSTDGANGDIYVADRGADVVDQFSSAGVYLGQLTGTGTQEGAFSDVLSAAVDDESHELYVGDGGAGAVDVFGPSIVIPDVTTSGPTGVGTTGRTEVGATLNGAVNPDKEGEASCQFDWGTSTGLGKVAPCPTRVTEGASPVAVNAKVTLQPDTTYYYRLQATNKNGTNPGEPWQVLVFTTPGPGLHDEYATAVSSSGATLNALIDPNNASTTYYIQYGESTRYEEGDLPASPGALVGSRKGDVHVERDLEGLHPGTTYHYRVVALSEWAPGELTEAIGSDHTFTTQAAASPFALLDNRMWEMVSPPRKLGAPILPISESGVIQAATGGGAIAYVTGAPTEAQAQGYPNFVQVLALRGRSGWQSRDIGIPNAAAISLPFYGPEYRFFSDDLSAGLLQPFGSFDPSLSAEASEQTPFLRTNYESGDLDSPCTESCYRPLVSGQPGHENVPPGTIFGAEPEPGECHVGGVERFCGPLFLGATPDLRHVVISSTVALTRTAAPQGGLYEWSLSKPASEQIELLSELPEEGATASSPALGSGWASEWARNAISKDGSRVVWSESGGVEALYLRDTQKGRTIQLGGRGAQFQDANVEGSRIFFSNAGELDECEIGEVAGALQCNLSDLTPAGGVLGMLGSSEEGSWIYFVAESVQSGSEVNQHGEAAQSGQPNLYVRHDGTTRLVAVLSSEDSPDWAHGSRNLQDLTARISPDGRWLAFMSQRELTGYDNRDALSGNPDEEVYLYDGQSGNLVCASCDPTGARPLGIEYAELTYPAGLVGGVQVWPNTTWLAASIPGWTPSGRYHPEESLYQSRYLSNSGRLFFNSHDALVPKDLNGTEDVYEYEPDDVGSCTSSTSSGAAAFVTQVAGSAVDGCVGLISSGTSPEESAFLDASETGGDVFFLTAAELSPQDSDTALDIYDAQECTGASPCLAPPQLAPGQCMTTEACRGAPTPQPASFGALSSATISGAGDLTTPSTRRSTPKKASKRRTVKCPREGTRGHRKCVKSKSTHEIHPRKAKVTNWKRRR